MSNLLDPEMLFSSIGVGIVSYSIFYFSEMSYMEVLLGLLTLVVTMALIFDIVKSIREGDFTSNIKSGEADTDKTIQTFRESSDKNHQEIMSLIQVLANKK
ncbi:MAG: hypothetical protein Ta2D_00350 [Rickettsiales bacterium]|nr:MAG: hypothetical protein Ta2D_00350 [Rickettsiales bacterium]